MWIFASYSHKHTQEGKTDKVKLRIETESADRACRDPWVTCLTGQLKTSSLRVIGYLFNKWWCQAIISQQRLNLCDLLLFSHPPPPLALFYRYILWWPHRFYWHWFGVTGIVRSAFRFVNVENIQECCSDQYATFILMCLTAWRYSTLG